LNLTPLKYKGIEDPARSNTMKSLVPLCGKAKLSPNRITFKVVDIFTQKKIDKPIYSNIPVRFGTIVIEYSVLPIGKITREYKIFAKPLGKGDFRLLIGTHAPGQGGFFATVAAVLWYDQDIKDGYLAAVEAHEKSFPWSEGVCDE